MAKVKVGTNHPWFYTSEEGSELRTIIKHAANCRDMLSHVNAIAASFCTMGLVDGISGHPWLLWSKNAVPALAGPILRYCRCCDHHSGHIGRSSDLCLHLLH